MRDEAGGVAHTVMDSMTIHSHTARMSVRFTRVPKVVFFFFCPVSRLPEPHPLRTTLLRTWPPIQSAQYFPHWNSN